MKPSKADTLAKRLAEVKKWPRKLGKANHLSHLKGGRLTMKEAIQAKCYDCAGGEDTAPCNIPNCPLIDYCPYGESEESDDLDQLDLFLSP